MKRTTVNFVVDALGFVAFVLLASTGVLTRYVLPAGSGQFLTLWGLDRHGWGHVHFWIAAVLIATMTVHVVLHWGWIVCVIRGNSPERAGRRLVLAVAALLVLLALAIVPFLGPVEETGEPPHRERSTRVAPGTEDAGGAEEVAVPAREEHEVHGSMTLLEIEQVTGVPVSHILRELGLPSDVSPGERLGRLKRAYGFETDDVRDIVRVYGERGFDR